MTGSDAPNNTWREAVLLESRLTERRAEIERELLQTGLSPDAAREQSITDAYNEGRKNGRITDGQDLYGSGR